MIDNDAIPAYYLTLEWQRLRQMVLDRDSGVCRYCDGEAQTADHVFPRGHGGRDTGDNLVACCHDCNALAGGRRFKSVHTKKRWIREERRRVIARAHKAAGHNRFKGRLKGTGTKQVEQPFDPVHYQETMRVLRRMGVDT